MPLPHRLIIDGVEQCASDDKKDFLRMAYLYLGDLKQEILKSRPGQQWLYYDGSKMLLKGVDDD